ncbi:MAG: glutamine--fructose-6-phosphate transaminase (isomerizing) [Polyangiales bacterium]
MCGIMGYVGEQPAWEIVLSGLRRLEYRGYDSAGIAILDADGKLTRVRRVGPLRVLAQAAPEGLPGNIAIGHTRWATHGGVTEANCHPHFDAADADARVAVVHNGVLDNAEALRASLAREGARFSSETDTELLAVLIGRAVDGGSSLRDAVVAALKRIEGTAGLLAIDRRAPDRIVAARVGSPVVVGIGEHASWVASDALALRPYTDRMIVLDDGEIADLTAHGVTTVDLALRDRDKRIEKIAHSQEDAERGSYPHFLLKEIHEQPSALDRSLRGRVDTAIGSARLGGLAGHEARLFDVARVVLFASGGSLHAAQVGAYLLNRHARMPATAEDGAELLAHNPIVKRDTLYIALSQSGETADTLATLREIRERGGLALGITNVPGSSLARATDLGVYLRAGPEVSVASTKALTAQVLALELLSLRFARMRDLSATEGRAWAEALLALPAQVAQMLEHAAPLRALAEQHAHAPYTMFIGRGASAPIASEGALKLKEVAYLPAEGMSGAAMKHGPLALVERGTPVWAVVPPDETRERMLGNLHELSARGASILAIADARDREVAAIAQTVVPLPPHHPATSPILTVVPLQLYAYYAAIARGCEVDQPRNLAKSVTVL